MLFAFLVFPSNLSNGLHDNGGAGVELAVHRHELVDGHHEGADDGFKGVANNALKEVPVRVLPFRLFEDRIRRVRPFAGVEDHVEGCTLVLQS